MNCIRKYSKCWIPAAKFYSNLKISNFYVKHCWKGMGDRCGRVNVKPWLIDTDKWEHKLQIAPVARGAQ